MNITRSEIIQIISEVKGIASEEIVLSESFSEIGVNSINFVEIVMKIEAAADGEFDEDKLSPVFFESIGDFVALVEEM